MINKKGSLVLRDIVFMMMISSAIFVFAGLFVSEMALNYDNTNMSNEWALTQTNDLANSTFYNTGSEIEDVGDGLDAETGIWALISGILDGVGTTLEMILLAPNTIGNLTAGMLEDAGVPSGIAYTIKYLIITIFWGIIIFVIISAFLQGGKL